MRRIGAGWSGSALLTLLICGLVIWGLAPVPAAAGDGGIVPDLGSLIARDESSMAAAVNRYRTDWRALWRRYDVRAAEQSTAAMRRFLEGWERALEAMEFESLDQEGRVDWLLLRNRIDYELRRLDREERVLSEVSPLLPFADQILALQVARREFEPIEPAEVATRLHEMKETIEETRAALERGLEETLQKAPQTSGESGKKTRKEHAAAGSEEEPRLETTRTLAHRASQVTSELREGLADWFAYYDGYHPSFSWWVRDPYAKVDAELEAYFTFLREQIVGEKEGEDPPVVGDPIGREALIEELALEMIPYTPEQLLAIAREQFAWCDREMLRASRDLGYGDDWRAALEKVKTLHVEPGAQPDLVRRLADEAVAFLEARDLLTIPPLASEIWRMEMMSPERQKVNPFFTGGEVISVSFPTDTMSHDEKWMSLRGNNIHFSRATVHHELIPGHHLQGFMTSRYNSHRRVFHTPFWGEGWALYWEMLLWDLDFPQSPEDRIGMLFWRMHRCARIIFSLGFHLGQMTPEEAIEFLIERVGHEPENAEAEVRRSFEGSYPPLYQAAYMLGGLQIRALHEQLVGSGQMTDREFHDAILEGGPMPIEMVRVRLLDVELSPSYAASWMFAGEDPGEEASTSDAR
jgi:uncharacterized protein (DUF885 family)